MMNRNWQRKVERWHDGELPPSEAEAVARLLEQADAQVYREGLEKMAEAARARMPRQAIADAQFPAFLAGIREAVEVPQRGYRGFWAALSLSTAALIVALSMFLIFTLDDQAAVHSSVEAATTDIEGASIDTYSGEDGTAVVWVTVGGSDAW